MSGAPWDDGSAVALLTDQYELTMVQAYWAEGFTERAVFSLFVRRLPESRNFLLAAGLDSVLDYLEGLRFSDEARAYLSSTGLFRPEFVGWLGSLRFSGDVRAVPEGTPVFAEEPLLEIEAPLPEAQLVETLVLNQMHLQTMLASKGARVKAAAGERTVIDFGLRRIHGVDAGLKAARAFHIAGLDGTSNVLAGKTFGIPVSGTMAHSYIQAHDDELDAFRAFTREFPETVLLVDTYDTLEGIGKVIALARELGAEFRVRAIRLDSGDLAALARSARAMLDAAGLQRVRIFASGGLDEWRVRDLVRAGTPVDGFGVGTNLGVSADAPSLDMVYKMTGYAGKGRIKLASGKRTLPGRKQVFRLDGPDGRAARDVVARADERCSGRPLLHTVMEGGRRLTAAREPLERARERAREGMAALPERLLGLDPAEPPYEVVISDGLLNDSKRLIGR